MGGRQQAEVSRELRTHILDSADAIADERKTTVDEAIVREVIANMGPARRVAALYPTPKAFLEVRGLRGAITGLGGLALAFLMVAGLLWLVAPSSLDAIPVQLILGIVGALAIAMIVITIIFLAMYVYDTAFRTPYEARLKRFNKSLEDAGSPLKVFFTILMVMIGLVIINVFWTWIPFISSLGPGSHLIPLFAPAFGGFVIYYNLIGVLTIAAQLLCLAVRIKWLPLLLEAGIGVVNALMALWILTAFPFNPDLSGTIQAGIHVFLAFVVVVGLIDVTVKLWKSGQIFIHGLGDHGLSGGA